VLRHSNALRPEEKMAELKLAHFGRSDRVDREVILGDDLFEAEFIL
jgi:hypothetical protein